MASDRDTLPDAVKPRHYDLTLYDLELGGAFAYQGTVSITLDVKQETKEITLNAHQLRIAGAQLFAEQSKRKHVAKVSQINLIEEKQRATITFDEALPVADGLLLVIEFQGTMNNSMAGFYRSRYKPAATPAKSVPRDDEYHYMFSTQFESCDARRAFPCFDEPNLKATFDFEIEIPDDQVALSNMPVKDTRSSKKDGFQIVSFDRTPVMSTYLLAWAAGDFEYVEDFTRRKYNGKNLPVRVYTTKGLKEQGRWALEHAHQITDYFSEIFQIDYPLPKVDLIAVHEFSHGAMENWGLITYRTTAVLFDEATSDQRFRNRVAYVVAHELAHQWFGNLVTMDWWNELWLNEGFATWVGWLAIDHLHPEWKVWAQFVSESLQTAMDLDSIRNSHPIEVPVRDALEVDQIFDHISYLKGSSTIRMLSAHLGVKTFLQGVSDYLKAHKYSNAKTADLWSALSKASEQDINQFMDPWIRKIGFPVVTVAEEPGQIGVQQKRFLKTGDAKPEEDETTWWIPLGIKTGSAKATSPAAVALTSKEETLRDIDESFYKVNVDQTGFFRTNYPPERLIKLGEARQQLSIEDKIGLVGDAAGLAQSGDGTTTGYLALIERFQDEQNYLVWSQVLSTLGTVKSTFSSDPAIAEALRVFTLKLITPIADKVGWDFAPNEDYLTGQLRALVISAAGLAGHKEIVSGALSRFKSYVGGDKSTIHPSLRLAVFRIAVKEGGKDAYRAVQKEYSTTTSIDGKEICLASLGRIQTIDLAQDLLDWLFSSAVATQDMHSVAASMAANSKVRLELWKYIKAHWEDKVYPDLSGNMVVLERFLRMSLKSFADFEVEKDIKEFYKDKDCRGFDRGLAVVGDTVHAAAAYKERDIGRVREWLAANGYLKV